MPIDFDSDIRQLAAACKAKLEEERAARGRFNEQWRNATGIIVSVFETAAEVFQCEGAELTTGKDREGVYLKLATSQGMDELRYRPDHMGLGIRVKRIIAANVQELDTSAPGAIARDGVEVNVHNFLISALGL